MEPEKCFWYLPDYDCVDGVWEQAKNEGCELLIPSDTGSPTPILSVNPPMILFQCTYFCDPTSFLIE